MHKQEVCIVDPAIDKKSIVSLNKVINNDLFWLLCYYICPLQPVKLPIKASTFCCGSD